MATLYRPLADLLREAGCRFERQGKGSHEIWYSPITRRTFTVPANNGRKAACECNPEAGRIAKGVLSSSAYDRLSKAKPIIQSAPDGDGFRFAQPILQFPRRAPRLDYGGGQHLR